MNLLAVVAAPVRVEFCLFGLLGDPPRRSTGFAMTAVAQVGLMLGGSIDAALASLH